MLRPKQQRVNATLSHLTGSLAATTRLLTRRKSGYLPLGRPSLPPAQRLGTMSTAAMRRGRTALLHAACTSSPEAARCKLLLRDSRMCTQMRNELQACTLQCSNPPLPPSQRGDDDYAAASTAADDVGGASLQSFKTVRRPHRVQLSHYRVQTTCHKRLLIGRCFCLLSSILLLLLILCWWMRGVDFSE